MTARSVVALALAALAAIARAQEPGTFKIVGNTSVSAMMMFLGTEENIYILDKAEGNPTTINGHPAWGSVWNIAAGKDEVVNVVSNSFCASGAFLPNQSWVALGGNNPISPGPVDYHGNAAVDPTYQDYDGRNAIRIVTPCNGTADTFSEQCQWYDDFTVLHMQARRWYSTAESLGTGEVLIFGGMVDGGYINRPNPYPNDPVTQNGLASNNFEFFPIRDGFTPQTSQFLVGAGGLNTYALAFLMPSGKVLLQANISTILFNTDTYEEEPLPDMPNNVVRVYPASGGAAVLPLTPDNEYTPTVLFCGGSNAYTNYQWGGYGGPNCNSWEYAASADCQRLTPEPKDNSTVAYEQDDDMIEGRTMGQFILLPDETMLMINGAANGTAGYTTSTPEIPVTANLPFGLSLANSEVLTPAIYYPNNPRGSRWSNAGLSASTIPRMYHSSAIVLPDASVFVAGSNPNGDVNATVTYALPYPAEYRAEIWYPPYWGKQRPAPTGVPSILTYGGDYFNITLTNGSYPGSANSAASKTKVVLLRSGFTTHAMNMGQRLLRLNSTYTVSDTADITLHVSQLPPNANLFTPGPAMLYVVTDGVPSTGVWLNVGSGNIEVQPTNDNAVLPPMTNSTVLASDNSDNGSTKDSDKSGSSSSSPSLGLIIGAAAGGIAAAAALAALVWFICRRKNRNQKVYDARNQPFESNQAFVGAGVSGQGFMRPESGYADSGYNTPAGYGAYAAGGAPGAVTGAPFASRGMYTSASPSETDLPVQTRNYDQMAGARVPSQYSVNSEPYSGMSPDDAPRHSGAQPEYYDPYQAYQQRR